jgi:hypothetical protein
MPRKRRAGLRPPGNAPFPDLIPLLPPDYRPLLQALVDENNQLLGRVRQRARQNHVLLRRSVELMQELLRTLFPARQTSVYNGQGRKNAAIWWTPVRFTTLWAEALTIYARITRHA